LVDFDYGERSPAVAPDAVVKSLTEAVDWILSKEAERRWREK
jgi:hypothetical protein